MNKPIIKKLSTSGNSKCVILTKTMLELCNIDEATTHVKIHIEGQKIIIEREENHVANIERSQTG